MRKQLLMMAAVALLAAGCRPAVKVIGRADMPEPLTIASTEGAGLADFPTAEKTPEILFEGASPVRSALVADGGRLFFGNEANEFYALDIATGEVLWKYGTDAAVETEPVVDGGRIVFNAANTLYVLDASTGRELHKTACQRDAAERVSDDMFAFNDSRAAVSGDVAWFAALDGNIVEVALAGGDVVRTFSAVTPGEVASGVDILDGRLYWVDHAGMLCCLDVARWELVFLTMLEDRVFAPMYIADGKIYLGGRSCKIYCVDAADGDVLWSSFSLDPTTWFSGGSVAVGDVLWTCTSDEHTLLGLDRNTGAFRRLLPTETNGYTRPALHGNNVIVAATDVYSLARSDVMEFDTARNVKLWQATLDDGVLSSPVVAGDMLFVASESGMIYKFALCDR